MITKTVVYDSTYFLGALENVAEDKTLTYFIIAAVMLGIGLIFLRKRKLKNHKKRKKFEI